MGRENSQGKQINSVSLLNPHAWSNRVRLKLVNFYLEVTRGNEPPSFHQWLCCCCASFLEVSAVTAAAAMSALSGRLHVLREEQSKASP